MSGGKEYKILSDSDEEEDIESAFLAQLSRKEKKALLKKMMAKERAAAEVGAAETSDSDSDDSDAPKKKKKKKRKKSDHKKKKRKRSSSKKSKKDKVCASAIGDGLVLTSLIGISSTLPVEQYSSLLIGSHVARLALHARAI